jgi:hypothetical protein
VKIRKMRDKGVYKIEPQGPVWRERERERAQLGYWLMSGDHEIRLREPRGPRLTEADVRLVSKSGKIIESIHLRLVMNRKRHVYCCPNTAGSGLPIRGDKGRALDLPIFFWAENCQ